MEELKKNNTLYFFNDELHKHAGVLSKAKKTIELAGRHPFITLGLLGGGLAMSQVPRIANKMLGLYMITNEPKERKLLKKQMEALNTIAEQTKPVAVSIDERRIPVRSYLA